MFSPPSRRGMGGAGEARQLSTPIFFLQAAKRKRRWSRQKKKRVLVVQPGRSASSCTTGCDSKRSCSINAAPAGARAGSCRDFRTLYAVLHSEVVGQKPNLTSYYLRAFRFAKRCLGGRRGGPPFGDGSCVDSRPSLASAGADASLRAGWLGWLIGLSVGADAYIGPLLGL